MGWKDGIREKNYEALTGRIGELLCRRVSPCASILDVGCGDGRKTLLWAKALGISPANICGVEGYAAFREKAAESFRVECADLESDALPWASETFDLVVANQVLEHIKNIFHLMGELSRVTKVGGHLLLSTPNLASFHNRILLAMGRQPTPIQVFCEHVRGFTAGALEEFALASGDFGREAFAGSGFYPLPPGLGQPLAILWPGGAVYTVLLLKRQKAVDPGYWARWAASTQDTQWLSAPAPSGGERGGANR